MTCNSLKELVQLEEKIRADLRRIPLGNVLRSLFLMKQRNQELPEFLIAWASLFAIRFCRASDTDKTIKEHDARNLISDTWTYCSSDPIVFDSTLKQEFVDQNPAFVMVRIASSQFSFSPGLYSQFARPALLFDEIPKQLNGEPGVPAFDFGRKFTSLNKMEVLEFVDIGFIVFSSLMKEFSISREKIQSFQKRGLKVSSRHLKIVLDQLAVDQSTFIKMYKQHRNEDSRFRSYDFNPLLSHPLIRPGKARQKNIAAKDFIHAPVPELIASRMSSGIFYQMFNEYKSDFSKYFGYVFEKYCGLVLEKSTPCARLISESSVRDFYPTSEGKCPDWIVVEGSTMIMFECKATRFSRAAQSVADEDSINYSLRQVKKGLMQLSEFEVACQTNGRLIQNFGMCDKFQPVLVSFEPMHTINGVFFKEHISNLLGDSVPSTFKWRIASIDELEGFQPHVGSRLSLSYLLEKADEETYNSVIEEACSQTGKTFEHSFLYEKQKELYERLGFPEE